MQLILFLYLLCIHSPVNIQVQGGTSGKVEV
jgi:hypothetical protein